MQRSILRSPSRIILSSPPSIRHSSSRPSPSFTPSHDESPSTTPSASSYLAQQALLEEEDEELSELIRKKKKRVPVELREPVWEGEETREAMLKRILEDQYKPLRVKVIQHSFSKSMTRPIKKLILVCESEIIRVIENQFLNHLHCLPHSSLPVPRLPPPQRPRMIRNHPNNHGNTTPLSNPPNTTIQHPVFVPLPSS